MHLIAGPPLLGFADAFDGAYGQPLPTRPPRVTPSAVGGILLPFVCPFCGKVRPEAVDPEQRGDYHDKARGFSWCPACRKRYILDVKGMPLKDDLPAGAIAAPALVERDGQVTTVTTAETESRDGLDLLGALAA